MDWYSVKHILLKRKRLLPCKCIFLSTSSHSHPFTLSWPCKIRGMLRSKHGTKNTPIPNTFVSFYYVSAMLIGKAYLGQHLSSELKKEKNKTVIDWIFVPKWKYRNHLLMVYHLLVKIKCLPLIAIRSLPTTLNKINCSSLLSIWPPGCTAQLASFTVAPIMLITMTEENTCSCSYLLLINSFFLLCIALLFFPEIFGPSSLIKMAKMYREQWNYLLKACL